MVIPSFVMLSTVTVNPVSIESKDPIGTSSFLDRMILLYLGSYVALKTRSSL